MANPKLLLCDEIRFGLSPIVIREIYEQLERITANETTVILVEQDVKQAMAVADLVYCFREGRELVEGGLISLLIKSISKASICGYTRDACGAMLGVGIHAWIHAVASA